MTTQSWNTNLSHANDAGFRAWGLEVSTRLAAIGLVQTADTGQVNWATVTRPVANTYNAYEIWRFNDTMQATAPVFIKIEYGTGGSPTAPSMRVTVATGSNGSGTLTGTSTSAHKVVAENIPASIVNNYPSFACATDGQAWICNKYGLSGSAHAAMFFHVKRTCDSAGVPDGRGVTLKGRNSTTTSNAQPICQSIKFSPGTVYTADTSSGAFCVNPHDRATSVVGGNTQVFMHWNPIDGTSPEWASCSMLQSEASFGTAFPGITLVGVSAPHNYLALGNAVGRAGPTTQTNALGMCVVYE